MKEIKIIIGKRGKISINVDGVTGPACKELTKRLESKLGKVTKVSKKSAFYQQTQNVSLTQTIG